MGGVFVVDCMEQARRDAKAGGFRFTGIYHVLWVVKKLAPEQFESLLDDYGVDGARFVKMMEVVLRPRRAGGGLPSDRHDANLAEAACAAAQASCNGNGQATVEHLLSVLPRLEPDPIADLCERFGLEYRKPAGRAGLPPPT